MRESVYIELTRKALKPLVKVWKHIKISPNIITFIGFLFSLLAGFLIINNWLVIGGLCVLLRYVLDILDGEVAKYYDRSTVFGGWLDETFDRLGDIIILVSVAVNVLLLNSSFWVIMIVLGGLVSTTFWRFNNMMLVEFDEIRKYNAIGEEEYHNFDNIRVFVFDVFSFATLIFLACVFNKFLWLMTILNLLNLATLRNVLKIIFNYYVLGMSYENFNNQTFGGRRKWK